MVPWKHSPDTQGRIAVGRGPRRQRLRHHGIALLGRVVLEQRNINTICIQASNVSVIVKAQIQRECQTT